MTSPLTKTRAADRQIPRRRPRRVGIEASSLGVWLYHELKARGFPVIMVEADHMRTALSAMRAFSPGVFRAAAKAVAQGRFDPKRFGLTQQQLIDAIEARPQQLETIGVAPMALEAIVRRRRDTVRVRSIHRPQLHAGSLL